MDLSIVTPTVLVSNDFCRTIIDIERAGIRIDTKALDKLEQELDNKLKVLWPRLNTLAKEAMGDTPFNLNSPQQLSEIIYSLHVKDKKIWKAVFQLGTQQRGAVKKTKKPRYFNPAQFRKALRMLTTPIYKTTAKKCEVCNGTGRIEKLTKSGDPHKNKPRCSCCDGRGFNYTVRESIAGFRVRVPGSRCVRATGFSTDSESLKEIIKTGSVDDKTKEFLQGLVDYREASKYKTTFVQGIRKAIRSNGRVHSSIMQTVAATGRLSSQNPNFHNQPRGATFPIRRVVVSRFPEGLITDADYSQLEFRVAAQLSGCVLARDTILSGKDAHIITANIITEGGQDTNRQEAKAHTFKPLFGGQTGTAAEQRYYRAFLDELYPGISAWHERLLELVLRRGYVTLPSGRTYRFRGVRRYPSGGVSNSTQIKNYPVQGFATADIVPLATIQIWNEYNKFKLKSLLINEVHDSIITDTHPKEAACVAQINKECMENIKTAIRRWYGYDFSIPLEVEVKQGPNWLDTEKVL